MPDKYSILGAQIFFRSTNTFKVNIYRYIQIVHAHKYFSGKQIFFTYTNIRLAFWILFSCTSFMPTNICQKFVKAFLHLKRQKQWSCFAREAEPTWTIRMYDQTTQHCESCRPNLLHMAPHIPSHIPSHIYIHILHIYYHILHIILYIIYHISYTIPYVIPTCSIWRVSRDRWLPRKVLLTLEPPQAICTEFDVKSS